VLQETASESREQNSAARASWWRQIREWKAEHPLTPEVSTSEIKPQHVMREIDRLSGGRAIVTSDVGQHRCGRRSLSASIPRACGSTRAAWDPWDSACHRHRGAIRPADKLVFSIVGDGGFQMSIPELATIANHALPIKIIVVNNGYLGMVRQWQELFYNNRLSQVELNSFPDAEKLAGAYGFKAAPSKARISWLRRSKKRCASLAPTC